MISCCPTNSFAGGGKAPSLLVLVLDLGAHNLFVYSSVKNAMQVAHKFVPVVHAHVVSSTIGANALSLMENRASV